MSTLPRNSIPSMGAYMQGLKVEDRSEQALLVRIGNLIDAIVATQRGTNNASSNLSRRRQEVSRRTPGPITGTTENVFNAVAVNINPIDTDRTISHYDVQIDTDPNFSDPQEKNIFLTAATFKGLTNGQTYHIRSRPVTKEGITGPWSLFDPVAITAGGSTTADFDGTLFGVARPSKSFTFTSVTQDLFAMAATPPVNDFDGVHTAHTRVDDEIAERSVGAFYYHNVMDSAIQETAVFSGTSSSDVASDGFTLISAVRYPAIVFFNLIEPGDAPSSHIFRVINTDNDDIEDPKTWVQF